jgi:hypothetical protein
VKEPKKKRKLSGFNTFQKEFWKNIREDENFVEGK